MKDKKITFKYFSIAEYEKEEAYLRKMHQQGWKLVKISLRYLYVRAYIFEKCQPEDVITASTMIRPVETPIYRCLRTAAGNICLILMRVLIFGRKRGYRRG